MIIGGIIVAKISNYCFEEIPYNINLILKQSSDMIKSDRFWHRINKFKQSLAWDGHLKY